MTSPQPHDCTLDLVDENEEWAQIEKLMANLDTGFSCDTPKDDEVLKMILEGGVTAPRSQWKHPPPSREGRPFFSNELLLTHGKEVSEWLTRLGLSKYEHVLVANGFDDLQFLGPEVMTETDLIEIGVDDAEDRNELLKEAANLPCLFKYDPQYSPFISLSSSPSKSSSMNVEEWLRVLRLSEYFETFKAQDCSQLRDLLKIWDLQLTSVFHISRLGHRNRMIASINSLRASDQRTNSKTSRSESSAQGNANGCHENETRPKTTREQSIFLTDYLLHRNNLQHNINNSNSGSQGEISLFKDYSSLRSSKSGRSSASSTLRRQAGEGEAGETQDSERESRIITLEEVLRNCGVPDSTITVMSPSTSSPSSSSLTTARSAQAASTSNSPHRTTKDVKPSDVVANCSTNPQLGQSNFSVAYLGSVKLRSIERPDLARRCIEQIRLSPVENRKVVISVSHKQVVFRDLMTEEILGAHDVSNVFCACQDSELLEYFAFVTWDAVESVHFCHVFNAQYVKLSTDIVLALGKAFEVAYQLIQQEVAKQNGRSPPSPTFQPRTASQRPQTASEPKSTFV